MSLRPALERNAGVQSHCDFREQLGLEVILRMHSGHCFYFEGVKPHCEVQM